MNANSRPKRIYHYHAGAHALSGQFWRPFQRVIEVQAASVLPSIGGLGNSRAENFKLDDVVSFKAGYSHVLGSKKEELDNPGKIKKTLYTTRVTATIEALNILDVVTADRIVARLTSTHDLEQDEACIHLVGSKFENLRIAGCEVEVELRHDVLLPLETFAAVKNQFANNGEIRKMAESTLEANLHPEAKLPDKLESHGALLCSIVDDVIFKYPGHQKNKEKGKDKHPCPGVERHGKHMFHVLDFGRIYLAECLFQHGQKTLTMLRIEFGSPNGGTMSAATAFSNGRTWP